MGIIIGNGRETSRDWGIVETLPTAAGGARKGDLCTYKAAAGVYWRLTYTGEAEFPWASVGEGIPLVDEINTAQGTKSATYTGLATAGPQITVPLKGDYDVEIATQQFAGGTNAWMSYKIGATAASNENGIQLAGNNNAVIWGTRRKRKTGLAASTLLLAQYMNEGAGAIETIFNFRQMRVWPVRVG